MLAAFLLLPRHTENETEYFAYHSEDNEQNQFHYDHCSTFYSSFLSSLMIINDIIPMPINAPTKIAGISHHAEIIPSPLYSTQVSWKVTLVLVIASP